MRGLFLLIFAVFLSGCAPFSSPWKLHSYEPVKTCEKEDLKIVFYVRQDGRYPLRQEDIFRKEMIVRGSFRTEKYGKVVMWLKYGLTPEEDSRAFPEALPDRIVIETLYGKKKFKVSQDTIKEFFSLWKDFMTPSRLTFVENCVYGF